MLPATILFATAVIVSAAEMKMIPVVEREGRPHVSASLLANEAGVAIKQLPGQNAVAACYRERCVLIQNAILQAREILVPVASLAEALRATAQFDDTGRKVGFVFADEANVPVEFAAGVGRLAPNIRLTRTDGSAVALSDFRGQRVLINSWASW